MYKEIFKDMFIDSHKWSDKGEDWNYFLTKIEELKLYIVEFNENSAMKVKNYLIDYIVRGEKCCSINVIIHDGYIFSVNDGTQKIWTWERGIFLWSKRWGQEIMSSNFLLLFGWFNLAFLFFKKRKKVMEKCDLLEIKSVKVFKYGKNNNGYWDRTKLHK